MTTRDVADALLTNADTAIARFEAERDRASEYASHAKTTNTKRAYQSDWRDFAAYCDARGRASLPADIATVAAYLAHLADSGRKPATIQRRMVSMNKAHALAGYDAPATVEAIGEVWDGIKRVLRIEQTGKEPILADDLRAMVAMLPSGPLGARDRALLTLGFAGAFRRTELVAIDVADVREVRDGLEVSVRRSKTDQEGAGFVKAIPYGSNPGTCPVRAYRDWTAASGISSGPVFRAVDRHENVRSTQLTSQVVALVVKRAATAAGLDARQYAGHSLRAGLVTAAKLAGKSDDAIMDMTGHKSGAMLRRYRGIRDRFADNAASGIGL